MSDEWQLALFCLGLCIAIGLTGEGIAIAWQRRKENGPSRRLNRAAEGIPEAFKRGYDMARVTQRVVRTRSIDDLDEEEYAAVIKGLQVIVEVNEKPVDDEDEDDELEEPTKEYPAAKRLLAQLEGPGDMTITMALPGGGGGGSGAPVSGDDPRGGPDDPIGMPSRSPSGTGFSFTRRPAE